MRGKDFAEITQGIELVIKEQMAHPLPGQWAYIELAECCSGVGTGVDYLMEKAMSREQLDQLAPTLPVFIRAHPAMLWNTTARDDFLRMYEVEPTDENEEKAITISTTIHRSLVADRYFDTHLDELADDACLCGSPSHIGSASRSSRTCRDASCEWETGPAWGISISGTSA